MSANDIFPLVSDVEDSEDNYLSHYGVMGMKWGVRRNANKAGKKAFNKLKKLDKKASDLDRKALVSEEAATTARYKANQKRKTAFTKRGKAKADKLDESAKNAELTANMARAKANKQADNAKRWASKMNKAFKDTKITDVSYDQRQLGKKYLLDILEEDKK